MNADVVIDVGCFDHGQAKFASVGALAAKYEPLLLLGYDPLVEPLAYSYEGGRPGTLVLVSPAAAWVYDGTATFLPNGVESRLVEDTDSAAVVECFDLATLIRALHPARIVLKLDIEGGEYELLNHLYEHGADERLALLLVEWHPEHRKPTPILRCPVEEWWL